MEKTRTAGQAADLSEPERAKQPTPTDGFRFHCPVCESYRGIAYRPNPGYHILCAGCLAVLLVVKGDGQERTGLAVRPITDADLARITSDVHRALLAAKKRLLSTRLEVGAASSGGPSVFPPTTVERNANGEPE